MSTAPIDDGDPTVVGDASEASIPRRISVELEAGTHIDRYIVLERLGAGGMGVVYAAFDPSLDRKVALKLLRGRSDGSHGEAARARLLREARAMAQLRSPNVVAVYDVGEHDGHIWVAMEFVEGTTLRRWLRETERSWREVLDTFLLAGRGLAAAHACGIVHRDFKPDNVMIAREDGRTPASERVRVMDFGLARPVRSGESLRPLELTPLLGADSMELTRDGAIAGTPGYMAPEQHGSGPASAAADQFSFCVALWEALHGHRPFAGDSPTELAVAVARGHIAPAPPGTRVPAWVRAAVERGLSVAPENRWPDLAALLQALERDPTHRQRKLWALAGAVVFAAAGYGVVEARSASKAAACEATATELAEVWNDDAADTLRGNFAAAGDEGTTFERTRAWIDARADAWRQARVEVCRASEIEGRFDAKITERAHACLEEHRGRLATMLDALAGLEAKSLRVAVLAAADVPRADACTDVRSLALRPPPPEDDATRAGASEVRADLWRAHAIALTGDAERGLAIVAGTEDRVGELDDMPLLVEQRMAHAHCLSGVGKYEDAEAKLHESMLYALESNDAATAMRAASGLAFLVGYQLRRLPEGLRWGRVALAMLKALPDPPHAERIVVLRNLAVLEFVDGEHDAAIETFEEVLQLQTEMLGPDHPDLASALQNLAAAYDGIGDLERAAAMYERTRELVETQLGPNDPLLSSALAGLAVVHARTNRPEEALPLLQRAIEIEVGAHGPEHPNVAEALCTVGELHLQREHPTEALTAFERALAIEEKHHGAEHPRLQTALLGIAKAELELRRPDAAAAVADRALALGKKTREIPRRMAAHTFVAACARWEIGDDRPAAIALARRALEDARAGGPPAAGLVTEIESWLASHPASETD